MPKQSQVGKVAQETLLKFPNSSKRAIAELLVENYPQLFNSLEHARSVVRAYTRESGGNISQKNRVLRDNNFKGSNPFGLNYTKCKKRVFVNLPQSSNNILAIGDFHFPNQDNDAITLALNYGMKNKVNCIILAGDVLDNEPFTNHDAPPPSKTDVIDWFEMIEDFLDMLNKKFPKAHKVWLEGNHDNWYVRYLMKKAPMLFGDDYYRLPQRLNLKQRNIEFLEQEKILRAGKLQILHGHTIMRGMFSPVNPARGVFMKTKSSTAIWHVHQTSEHSESNLKGDITACWSSGALCTLSPDYDPHNTKHNLGFMHIKTEKNGTFRVENKRIINNQIY